MADKETADLDKAERARQRLDKAVAELERAVESRLAVAADLDAMRRENARLRSINDTVSKRLDSTIERLHALLESEPGGN